MLDSGSSISLIQESVLPDLSAEPRVVSAAGEPISVVRHVNLPVKIEQLHVDHSLVVVRSLITPVILGLDFLRKHCLVLDFTSTPIGVASWSVQTEDDCPAPNVQPIWKAAQDIQVKACAVVSVKKLTDETPDDCTVPLYGKPAYEMPHCPMPHLAPILDEFKDLFQTSPGCTNLAEHFILPPVSLQRYHPGEFQPTIEPR